jgi:hypothetical protein
MNELQKLNCPCVQVDKNSHYSTDWANVSKYKYLRITALSEQQGILYCIFSVDGIEKGITHTFKITPNKWDTFKVEVLCTFMKFEFVNGPEYNKRLLINVLGRHGVFSGLFDKSVKLPPEEKPLELEKVEEKKEEKKEEPEQQQQPEVIEHSEEEKKEAQRGKSPFRRFVDRKKVNSMTQKSETYDPRLPNLILRGNMLICDQTNKMSVIPAPIDEGDFVLCWSEGKPVWKKINEIEKWII